MKTNCVITHDGIRYEVGDEIPDSVFGTVAKTETVEQVVEQPKYQDEEKKITRGAVWKMNAQTAKELGDSLGIKDVKGNALKKAICDELGL